MKKFAVRTDTFEFDPSRYTPEEAYFAGDDHDDEVVALFDSIDEAKDFLEGISVYSQKFSFRSARAFVAFIEEADWDQDEDGEWQFISGSDIWDFKFEEVEV